MDQVSPSQMIEWFRANHPELNVRILTHEDIVFKKRNKLLCFYCSRYKYKWTCPPNIPDIDYQDMFNEYCYLALVYSETDIVTSFDDTREKSTVILHKALLDAEGFLLSRNNSTRISFIGGSCKLCKNGCASDKCRNPYLARIPLEATGVDVVETASNIGVNIAFPVLQRITRVGLLLW